MASSSGINFHQVILDYETNFVIKINHNGLLSMPAVREDSSDGNYSKQFKLLKRSRGVSFNYYRIESFLLGELPCVKWGASRGISIKNMLFCQDMRVITEHIQHCTFPTSFHCQIARRALDDVGGNHNEVLDRVYHLFNNSGMRVDRNGNLTTN